jgi:hypothetical protein
MLTFIDKPKFIYAYRAKAKDAGTKRIRIGAISKRKFTVRGVPGAVPTKEETQDMQTLADSYKAAAGNQRQLTALHFPETTRSVISYYKAGASLVEKRLIERAIRQAARTLRKGKRAKSSPEEAKVNQPKPPSSEPSAHLVAAALFRVLAQNPSCKVSGDPRTGAKTSLQGEWDLYEVAGKLMAFTP